MDSEKNTDLHRLLHEFIDSSMHRSMKSYFHFGRDNNLSYSQLIILHRIHRGGPTQVSEISKMLDISNSAVSQLLEKLVQMDLLTRWEKSDDRRKKYHSITEQGIKLVKKSSAARIAWISSMEEKISPGETKILTEALAIMVNKIQELDPIHHHHHNHCDHKDRIMEGKKHC